MSKPAKAGSTSNQVQAMAAALEGPLEPPPNVTLRAVDVSFWNAIVCARARDTWTDVDLCKAANLARCQSDIERISKELQAEGDTLANDRGTMVVNPKHSLLETLTRREIAISRAIHVHAEATVGRSADAGKKLEAEKKARGDMAGLADDGFVSRPSH